MSEASAPTLDRSVSSSERSSGLRSSQCETSPPCPICRSVHTQKIHGAFPGYVRDTSYRLFACENCDSQYADTQDSTDHLYNLIYSHGDAVAGYERYFRYAQQVGRSRHPLRFLARSDSVYQPVYDLCHRNAPMRILEVGCGYGYLTHAMRRSGHHVTGIDLSRPAIDFAKKAFGGDFFECTISDLAGKVDSPFDAVVATELIEHLADPGRFVDECLGVLTAHGKIIITTPNRDYYGKEAIWRTDLPPVHITWLGRQSFRHLASRRGLHVDFTDFRYRVLDRGNNLVDLLRRGSRRLPLPVIESDGSPNQARVHRPTMKVMSRAVHNRVVRTVSNAVHNLVAADHPTLGAVLRREP